MLLYFVTNYPFRVRNKEERTHEADLAFSQSKVSSLKTWERSSPHPPVSRLVSCKSTVSQAHLDGSTPGEASALLELQGTKSRCEEEEGDVGIGGEQKRGWSGLPVGGSRRGAWSRSGEGEGSLRLFLATQ